MTLEKEPLLPHHENHSPVKGEDPFRRRWVLILKPRDPEEPRTSTSLELLFDLIFAVAVSQSADGFQEMFIEGDIGNAVLGLLFTFFALWWPWANYAVFAAAYDNDDIRFRIYVFVQMIGSLFIAQGIKQAYHRDVTVMVIGYVILRLAQMTMWYLVSRHDHEHKQFAIRQAVSLAVLQTFWCIMVGVDAILGRPDWWMYLLSVGLFFEIGGYVLCERGVKRHPIYLEHLVDRFGEFTLIVLGETVFSWSATLNEASIISDYHPTIGMVAAAAFLGTLSLWWTYFDSPFEGVTEGNVKQFGLMHYLVFAATTCFGASIRIGIASAEGDSDASRLACAYAVAISMSTVILSHWFLRYWVLQCCDGLVERFTAPVSCVVMLLVPLIALSDTDISFGVTVLLIVLCNVAHIFCFVIRDLRHDAAVCKEQQRLALAGLNGMESAVGIVTVQDSERDVKADWLVREQGEDSSLKVYGSFKPLMKECSTQTAESAFLNTPDTRRKQTRSRPSGQSHCEATDFASVTVSGMELPPDQDDSVCEAQH